MNVKVLVANPARKLLGYCRLEPEWLESAGLSVGDSGGGTQPCAMFPIRNLVFPTLGVTRKVVVAENAACAALLPGFVPLEEALKEDNAEGLA